MNIKTGELHAANTIDGVFSMVKINSDEEKIQVMLEL
jgi:hypothetical protein